MTVTRFALTFLTALPCADCATPTPTYTHLGVVYHQEESRTYQLLPLCPVHFAEEFRRQDRVEEIDQRGNEATDEEPCRQSWRDSQNI